MRPIGTVGETRNDEPSQNRVAAGIPDPKPTRGANHDVRYGVTDSDLPLRSASLMFP